MSASMLSVVAAVSIANDATSFLLRGPVGETSERYASYTIDSSYNRGFVHIDFGNANLLAAASSLAPSTLRFGGGGNDYLQYCTIPVIPSPLYAPFSPCTPHNDSDTFVCLNTTHWTSLFTLAVKADAQFIFGLSFDMVAACNAQEKYTWSSAPAVAMIKYLISQKQDVWGYELGNEVNNRLKKCNLQPAQQAAAFALLKKELSTLYPDAQSRPKILGPDVGYLDPEYWLGSFLGNYSDLHAVTYHVYSWLNRKNYFSPMPIDNALTDGESWYPGMVHSLAPAAEVWAGEDGPIGGGEDGTCGGLFPNGSSTNNSVCGTFATAPWYANNLGQRALLGFKTYLRQDLLGGRYGLLGISHDSEMLGTFDPVRISADFWVNFMWKRIMGTTVFNVTATDGPLDPSLRAFAHCGTPPSPHAPRLSGTKTPAGLVLININTTEPKSVPVNVGAPFMSWTLSAADGVFGETSLLNGKPLPGTLSDGRAIEGIPVAGVPGNDHDHLTLPPFTVTFVATECPSTKV